MPIKDLQKLSGIPVVGRLRIGFSTPGKNGGKSPKRSETWIFTSSRAELLEPLAARYGGTVEPWDHDGRKEFRIMSNSNEVQVMVLPWEPSQWLELWVDGECVRRCDSEACTTPNPKGGKRVAGRCLCDPDNRECKPTSRLNFLLPEVPELGSFMLESKGYHVARELPQTMELSRHAGQLVTQAFLAIEQRSVKRNGQIIKFPVIVLRTKSVPRHLALGRGGHGALADQARALTSGTKALEAPEPVYEADVLKVFESHEVYSRALRTWLVGLGISDVERLDNALSALCWTPEGKPADLQIRIDVARKSGECRDFDSFIDYCADNGGEPK